MAKRSIIAWQNELQGLLLEFMEAKGKPLNRLTAMEFWKWIKYERQTKS
jgi:hypothetical protein